MAENESATPAEPTRRRRAASRPAGPPPEVASPFSAPVPETPAPEASEEKPARRRRAAKTETVEPAVTEAAPVEEAAEEKAPRATRRRATRAAATEGDEAAPAKRRSRAKAEAPAPAEDAQPDVAEAPAPEAAPEKPARASRRRATREVAAAEPAPVPEPTPETPAPDADPVPQIDQAPAEEQAAPARRSRRATRPAAAPVTESAPAEVPQTVAAGTAEVIAVPVEEQKPTRSRRASRPAAAPEPVESAPAEVPQTAAAGTAEVVAAPVEEQKPTRSRRASRPAAAPEPVEAAPADVPQTVAAGTAEVAPADAAPSRRRRASRPAAAPAPAAQQPEELRDSTPAEVVLGANLATSEDSTAEVVIGDTPPEPTERPSRRRRGRAADPEPAEPTSQPDEDGIAAALRMAEEAAQERRRLLADPFSISEEGRQAELAALAGAIAAGEEEEEEEPDEEPEATDEVEDEPTGDEEPETEPEETEDGEGERSSRRRRRRGGRRRRRGGSREDAEDSDESESNEDDAEGEEDQSAEADDSDSADSEDGVARRRRRRRRRGGSSDEGGSGSDEVTGIEGSTRMEAKRQRRKENRAAGRRRAPILSEAEFLARRESVERKMLIRQKDDYTQLAVLEDGILVEHYVDRASATSLIGNIYLGKVQNVLPSMEAAFIDIGRGRNAVLYAGEVDWDSFGVSAEDRRVEKVFKSGQSVLVQVTKDPVGAKGARLTNHISLPGRYVVYSPGGHLSGISRKLPDNERARLREILGGLISDEESVIVRTAAEGASSDELVRDVNRLKAQWEVIEKKVKQGKAPEALYAEPDLTLRIVRDLFTEDFASLVVHGNGGSEDAYDAISAYVSHVAPHLAERLEQFKPADDGRDLFSEARIDEQIAKALDRKVYLPSGGSLVIDRTEAMTVIDVNTGKFTGTGGNLEATVTSNNLEAAEEIVRQLRLRDLGGIIVIDFIDMVLPSNRDLLLRRLVECLGRDRTRHQVAEVTSLGLVQLTRKRIGTGLAEAFTEECEHCHGSGYLRYEEPVDSQAPSDGGERTGKRRRRGGK